jgi:hypothetical protein
MKDDGGIDNGDKATNLGGVTLEAIGESGNEEVDVEDEAWALEILKEWFSLDENEIELDGCFVIQEDKRVHILDWLGLN